MSLYNYRLPSLKDKLAEISSEIEHKKEVKEEKVEVKAKKGRRLNK